MKDCWSCGGGAAKAPGKYVVTFADGTAKEFPDFASAQVALLRSPQSGTVKPKS